MGHQGHYYGMMTPAERGLETKRLNALRREDANALRKRAEAVAAKRMALADKITMVVVDEIANAIIRPGPKPEERECYVMAQELREHSAPIKALVAAILAVEAEEED